MTLYSYSRISAFKQCPLKYKLTYIDRIPVVGKGVEAYVGICFHETMEKLYKDISFRVPALDELLAFFDVYWDKEWDENITIVNKERTAEDYRNFGKNCIQDYYNRYHPFNRSKVLGIETLVIVDLDVSGAYQMKGYVDRIDHVAEGFYEVHDYKTSGRMPGQDFAEEDIQLPLYQIAVMETWKDAKEVKLIWHYVKFDKELIAFRSAEQLENLKRNYIEMIQQVESTTKFLPQESTLCEWCDYHEHCSLKKHSFKVAALPENEYLNDDGVKLVDAYTKIKAEKAELNAKIKLLDEELEKIAEAAIQFGAKEGAEVLVGSENQLKIKEAAYLNLPKKADERAELETMLKAANKWNEVVAIQPAALKSVLSGEAWEQETAEKVKKLVNYRTGKSVSMSKLKEEKEE